MRNLQWRVLTRRLLTSSSTALVVSLVLSAGAAVSETTTAVVSIDTLPPVPIGTLTVCVDYDAQLLEPRLIDPEDASQGLEVVTFSLALDSGGVVIASPQNVACPDDVAVTGIFFQELIGMGDLMGVVFDRLAGGPEDGLNGFDTGLIEDFSGQPIPPQNQPEISVRLVPEPTPGALSTAALATLLYVSRVRGARRRRAASTA